MVQRPLEQVCGKDVGELVFGTWKAVERYKQNLMDHSGGILKSRVLRVMWTAKAWLGGFGGDKTLTGKEAGGHSWGILDITWMDVACVL